MARLLLVPHLGTAEDEVLVLEWLVKPQELYHKGQALVMLETLKASFEVEAEEEGVLLEALASVGDRLGIHAPLAVLGHVGELLDPGKRDGLLADVGGGRPAAVETGVAGTIPANREEAGTLPSSIGGAPSAPAAPAARRRATELGIELERVQGTGPGGMIRVSDVESAALRIHQPADASDAGRVSEALLARIRADEAAFAALSGPEKLEQYREHGAVIGPGCTLGPGSLILAERIVLGGGVTIRAQVRIEAVDLEIGAGTHFGDRCRVRCRRVRLGENAFFVTDVEIGGGGAMDPEASLEVGSHGFVGEHVHLNPCRPLRIGDEVVISRNASIMTHSFGLDALQGYPNRFAGVVIEDECQIGIGAVLFPGVTVGRGSILLSCSSLVTDLPAGRLFGGVPATDIKAAARPLSPEQKVGLAEKLVREFARQLELRSFDVELTDGEHGLELAVSGEEGRHYLRFAAALPIDESAVAIEDVRVGLSCDEGQWQQLPPELCAMDLGRKRLQGSPGPLGLAFREFLRKHGIRLSPRNWTYPGGWL